MRIEKFHSVLVASFFFASGVTALAQEGASTALQRQIQTGGTKVNFTETYRADSRTLLDDYLKDHPATDASDQSGAEVGRSNEFKFIVKADGNQATTVNLNAFITVEKGYVKLTREQKRSLVIIPVLSSYVKKYPKDGKTMIRFEVQGARIGENLFVRVTKDPDFGYRDDDEYYFIASKQSVQEPGAQVEKVDPIDLLLTAGSDAELEHFGLQPPLPQDYRSHYVIKDPYYPQYYPRTAKDIASLNAGIDKQNEVRWDQFVAELNRKRRELNVDPSSKTLKPELYFRYHFASRAGEDVRSPRYKIGTLDYLQYEWGISAPRYLPLYNIVNVPQDYNEAFTQFAARHAQENSQAHTANQRAWSEFIGAMQRVGIPNPFYTQYYNQFYYDGASWHTTWIPVEPTSADQDDPPRRGSLAELRKYGIELPKFWRQAILPGTPIGAPAIIVNGILSPDESDEMNDYNVRVRRHNANEWQTFVDAIRYNDLHLRDYEGNYLQGVHLVDPARVELWNEPTLYMYFSHGQQLPELADE